MNNDLIIEELIQNEITRRCSLLDKIEHHQKGEVPSQLLAENNIVSGESGIYRNVTHTRSISNQYDNSNCGVTVALRHTGGMYPDDLFDEGLIYHYPKTKRKGHDLPEINATKICLELSIPIFVILEGSSESTKNVKLGWIEDFDDKSETFLVSFKKSSINDFRDLSSIPFKLATHETDKFTKTKRRSNQAKFRYNTMKRYGPKCAVCSVTIKEMLHAAHLKEKKNNGTDDPRNGLILCLNHHAAFDSSLFSINPDDLSLFYEIDGLDISEKFLNTDTKKFPHKKALMSRWKK